MVRAKSPMEAKYIESSRHSEHILYFGCYEIPVLLHHGMTASDDTNTVILGGLDNGNFGQFVCKGGFSIHVSLCSPDILGTFLHEFAHLVMFQRSHLLAFSEDTPLPNMNECISDLFSDAFAELYRRNAALLSYLSALKAELLLQGRTRDDD